MKPGYGGFLEDVLESIELIEKRTEGITFEQFASDVDLQDMVIRRFEIIGEAVKHLPLKDAAEQMFKEIDKTEEAVEGEVVEEEKKD